MGAKQTVPAGNTPDNATQPPTSITTTPSELPVSTQGGGKRSRKTRVKARGLKKSRKVKGRRQ